MKLCYINYGCVGLLGAPTYRMLEDVLKKTFIGILVDNAIPFVPRWSDNKVTLTECQHEVLFRATDSYDRLRGPTLAWWGLDELTYTAKQAWEILQGRLSAPTAQLLQGMAAWTPKGYDWVWQQAIGPKKLPDWGVVFAGQENEAVLRVDPQYYERLKYSYDERFFRQEALGEYLPIFGGQAYYSFDREQDVKPCSYDPSLPLFWTLDFNVNPMSSVIGQIVPEREFADILTGRMRRRVRVLRELSLVNSNTRKACRAFLDVVKQWHRSARPITVYVYGDSSGDARSTASESTDWDQVKQFFRQYSHMFKVHYRVPDDGNPSVRARVLSVNSVICNFHGERMLDVDPSCEELITDLEQVQWTQDSKGNLLYELDKSDPLRTHLSDALGYLIEREFSLKTPGGAHSTVLA